MPYRVRSQQFIENRNHTQRAILAEAHRAAEQAVLRQMQHENLKSPLPDQYMAHAWVELDPGPFTRWCKNHNPTHADIPVTLPHFLGEPVPKTHILRFLCPGAPAEPISIIAAQAGATAFAWHIKSSGLHNSHRPSALRVVSAWGNLERTTA